LWRPSPSLHHRHPSLYHLRPSRNQNPCPRQSLSPNRHPNPRQSPSLCVKWRLNLCSKRPQPHLRRHRRLFNRATPAPEAPAPVTPPRTDAAHLNNPAPQYPALSRRLGEQGRVMLDVYILPDGSVGEIKLNRSSGFPRLDNAALQAVKTWKYVPAKRGDKPIPFWYVQPVSFVLNN
jgi:TonB family protein